MVNRLMATPCIVPRLLPNAARCAEPARVCLPWRPVPAPHGAASGVRQFCSNTSVKGRQELTGG